MIDHATPATQNGHDKSIRYRPSHDANLQQSKLSSCWSRTQPTRVFSWLMENSPPIGSMGLVFLLPTFTIPGTINHLCRQICPAAWIQKGHGIFGLSCEDVNVNRPFFAMRTEFGSVAVDGRYSEIRIYEKGIFKFAFSQIFWIRFLKNRC